MVFAYQNKPGGSNEMVETIKVGVNSDNDIDVRLLAKTLKDMGFLKESCSLSYLSISQRGRNDLTQERDEIYVYCGDTNKLNEAINIPWEEAVDSSYRVNMVRRS